MASLVIVSNEIKGIVLGYNQVKRFLSEFEDEIQNELTKSEKFYTISLVLQPFAPIVGIGENINEMYLRIYCNAPIQEGRENVLNIVSDSILILQDLWRDLYQNNFDGFSLKTDVMPQIFPEDKSRLDNLAGAYYDLTLEVIPFSACDIQKKTGNGI